MDGDDVENDLLVQLAKSQARQRLDLLRLNNEVNRLKSQIVPCVNADFLSVLGYANSVLKLAFPGGQLSAWSKRVGKYCDERNIKTEKVHDAVYGVKKIYPVQVLRDTYDSLGPKVPGEPI